jgi:hypothetical protein
MPKFFTIVAAAALLGLASTAFAADPMQLSERQMDTVTAGAASAALINLTALASGSPVAFAETQVTRATITQTPTLFPPTTLGTVFVRGFSVAAN